MGDWVRGWEKFSPQGQQAGEEWDWLLSVDVSQVVFVLLRINQCFMLLIDQNPVFMMHRGDSPSIDVSVFHPWLGSFSLSGQFISGGIQPVCSILKPQTTKESASLQTSFFKLFVWQQLPSNIPRTDSSNNPCLFFSIFSLFVRRGHLPHHLFPCSSLPLKRKPNCHKRLEAEASILGLLGHNSGTFIRNTTGPDGERLLFPVYTLFFLFLSNTHTSHSFILYPQPASLYRSVTFRHYIDLKLQRPSGLEMWLKKCTNEWDSSERTKAWELLVLY